MLQSAILAMDRNLDKESTWNSVLNLGILLQRHWSSFNKLTVMRQFVVCNVLCGTSTSKADDSLWKIMRDMENLLWMSLAEMHENHCMSVIAQHFAKTTRTVEHRELNLVLLLHPFYLPVLASVGFYLFPPVENGRLNYRTSRFVENDFQVEFQKWQEHWTWWLLKEMAKT